MSMWLTTKRVARYGLIGFVRNGFVSLAAVVIMLITLFVLAILVISGAALGTTLKDLTSKVDVSVYFTTNAPENQILDMQSKLQALPEVASVTYTSREQALADFRQRHANDQLIIQALNELNANPLGASLSVRAHQTSQYEAIARFLSDQVAAQGENSIIEKVNFEENKGAIERLTHIIEAARRVGIAITVIFALASILIAFNTLRLAIYTARDEIAVMRLVGAGRWYVRGPFIIAGVLYGLIAGLIVLILLFPILTWMGPASERFFGTFNTATYYTSHFFTLFLIIMGTGIGLGALSSYLAVRRYLRN